MSGLADEHIPIARTFHEIEVKAVGASAELIQLPRYH